MNIDVRQLLVTLALLGLACDGPAHPPEADAQRVAHDVETGPATAPTSSHNGEAEADDSAPASAAALLPLLRARHREDLPDAETLARHRDAAEGLRWLATKGTPLSVRARALSLLRHYPDATTRALLERSAETGGHASLRAAALRGLAGFADAPDDALRARLLDALRDDDPRVVEAAASVMASQASLRATLERVSDDDELSSESRARIQSALSRPAG